MKADIHPDYHPVLFRDLASGKVILTRSTATSSKTETWEDGNEYPIIEVEISSESHPFLSLIHIYNHGDIPVRGDQQS